MAAGDDSSSSYLKKRISDLEKQNSWLDGEIEESKRTSQELKADKARNYNLMTNAIKDKEKEIRALEKSLEDATALKGRLTLENEEHKLRLRIEEFNASARKLSDEYVDVKKEVERAGCRNIMSRTDATFATTKVNIDMKALLKKMTDEIAVSERSLEGKENN